jgi:predicted nucleic acid-binding protein
VSGSALLAAGLVLVVAAGLLLSAAARVRRRVRRTAWVLTRVPAAIGEAERAGRIRAELADTP